MRKELRLAQDELNVTYEFLRLLEAASATDPAPRGDHGDHVHHDHGQPDATLTEVPAQAKPGRKHRPRGGQDHVVLHDQGQPRA